VNVKNGKQSHEYAHIHRDLRPNTHQWFLSSVSALVVFQFVQEVREQSNPEVYCLLRAIKTRLVPQKSTPRAIIFAPFRIVVPLSVSEDAPKREMVPGEVVHLRAWLSSLVRFSKQRSPGCSVFDSIHLTWESSIPVLWQLHVTAPTPRLCINSTIKLSRLVCASEERAVVKMEAGSAINSFTTSR